MRKFFLSHPYAKILFQLLAILISFGVGISLQRPSAGSTSASTADPSSAGSSDRVSENLPPDGRGAKTARTRVPASITSVLATPMIDLPAVVKAAGVLCRLDDAEASIAFHSLANRQPRTDYVGSLVAGYLWSREREKNPNTPMPLGWNLEKYPEPTSSHDKTWDEGAVRAAIASGEVVSQMDRERFFAEELRRDPEAAFSFWLKHHHPEMQVEEASWFLPLFENPKSRSTLLDLINASDLDPARKQDLLCGIYSSWVLTDPEAAGRWLTDPSLDAYRTALERTYASLRVQTDPQNAWSLSDKLQGRTRLHAQIQASSILARDNPDQAIANLDTISDAAHRETLVQTFGEQLAIYHYDKWVAWRDSLPASEQDKVNAAAFESWIGEDPSSALQWMEKQANSPEKSRMMADFASRFANERADTVAAWIRTIPDANERLTIAIAGIRALPDNDFPKIRALLDAVN